MNSGDFDDVIRDWETVQLVI